MCDQCNHEDGIHYEIYGEDQEIPRPLQQLIDLGNRGKLVQTVYRPCASPWERLCALEADMLAASHSDNQEYDGWYLVSGSCAMLEDVTGWLEYGDWVFIACSKEYAAEHNGVDFLVIGFDDFLSSFIPEAKARVPLGESSGLELNETLREMERLESSL